MKRVKKIIMCAFASARNTPLLKMLKAEMPKRPFGIYLLKVNNRNARTRCEICSKLTTVNSPSIFNVIIFYCMF